MYTVNGSFYCDSNNLTSLQYCPTTVNGNFGCGNNNLETLDTGLDKKVFVKYDFYYGRQNNGKVFTANEVRKYFDLKGSICL